MLGSRLVAEAMGVGKAAAVDVKHGCTDKRSSRAGYVPIGGKNTVFKRFDNVHNDVSNFETDASRPSIFALILRLCEPIC